MARTSTEEALRNAFEKSKDFVDTVKDESRAMYEEARRWVPEHRTAVAVTGAAAVSVGMLGYALGRRRAENAKGPIAKAFSRAPEADLSPIFKFLGLWMLYRVAARALD